MKGIWNPSGLISGLGNMCTWERGAVLDWGGMRWLGEKTMANELKVKLKTLTPLWTCQKRVFNLVNEYSIFVK